MGLLPHYWGGGGPGAASWLQDPGRTAKSWEGLRISSCLPWVWRECNQSLKHRGCWTPGHHWQTHWGTDYTGDPRMVCVCVGGRYGLYKTRTLAEVFVWLWAAMGKELQTMGFEGSAAMPHAEVKSFMLYGYFYYCIRLENQKGLWGEVWRQWGVPREVLSLCGASGDRGRAASWRSGPAAQRMV